MASGAGASPCAAASTRSAAPTTPRRTLGRSEVCKARATIGFNGDPPVIGTTQTRKSGSGSNVLPSTGSAGKLSQPSSTAA